VGAVNGAYIASRPFAPRTADRLSKVWRRIGRGQVFPLNPVTGFLGFFGARRHLVSDGALLLQLEEGPCPSCVALLDQLDGAADHASQQINFAVVAKAPLPRLLTFAEERGWRHLRLLSSAGNDYNRDYLGESADGFQIPMLNVFHRDGDLIRHFWGAELTYAPMDPGQDHRSVGTLEPLWNLFDLTREGRPSDWDEQLSYS
jgi:predicted dithiol-disulfide oxidoreductase (DUF899 family)